MLFNIVNKYCFHCNSICTLWWRFDMLQWRCNIYVIILKIVVIMPIKYQIILSEVFMKLYEWDKCQNRHHSVPIVLSHLFYAQTTFDIFSLVYLTQKKNHYSWDIPNNKYTFP